PRAFRPFPDKCWRHCESPAIVVAAHRPRGIHAGRRRRNPDSGDFAGRGSGPVPLVLVPRGGCFFHHPRNPISGPCDVRLCQGGAGMTAPRVLFITGKLAEPALRRVLAEVAPRAGIEPEVAVLPISVAALLTTEWIARHLTPSADVSRIVLPGFVRGE